jgi:FkbM family methyltransferase
VVAFEPNPRVLPELRARCGSNPNWTLVTAALGSGASIATLYARAAHANSGLSQGGEILATYDIPVVTLDAAIRRFGPPAFCKIDVEGWEPEVLKGLSEPIPLLSFEFSLSERGAQRTLACLERLAAFGPSLANLTPAETPRFHFPEWMPLADLLAWFPGDLKQTLPGDSYGDIYVRREAGH